MPRSLTFWDGDPRIVVVAPHGKDFFTDEIAAMVCGLVGCRGMAVPHMEDPTTGLRVNVNRPTEGAGLTADEETETELAHEAYRMYLGLVLKLGDGRPPELYVEIHGNEDRPTVEVATVRISDEQRAAVKAALDGIPSGSTVEGIDPIVLDADQSRQHGILRFIPRALHFECSEVARKRENRGETARAIARAIVACDR